MFGRHRLAGSAIIWRVWRASAWRTRGYARTARCEGGPAQRTLHRADVFELEAGCELLVLARARAPSEALSDNVAKGSARRRHCTQCGALDVARVRAQQCAMRDARLPPTRWTAHESRPPGECWHWGSAERGALAPAAYDHAIRTASRRCLPCAWPAPALGNCTTNPTTCLADSHSNPPC
ncbi:hypothetical protein CERSUDRAFT_120337 [Gelatoporia subvermispora B]|uniref:Uncharacterized protein n=1 Tax=Ceriporiopsis subvermispora (strain B) TaxID=914234 RepID=M2QW21_CERS8|nr:hypothetical protein CERSUDRAFT_120337 [Gelatoporia subvermispora B]